jgi:hypothetical protein
MKISVNHAGFSGHRLQMKALSPLVRLFMRILPKSAELRQKKLRLALLIRDCLSSVKFSITTSAR